MENYFTLEDNIGVGLVSKGLADYEDEGIGWLKVHATEIHGWRMFKRVHY